MPHPPQPLPKETEPCKVFKPVLPLKGRCHSTGLPKPPGAKQEYRCGSQLYPGHLFPETGTLSRHSPLPFKLSPKYPFPLSEQFLPWLEAFAETIYSIIFFLFPNTHELKPLTHSALAPSFFHPQLLFSTSSYFLSSLTSSPLQLPPQPVDSTWRDCFSQSKQRFSHHWTLHTQNNTYLHQEAAV